MNLQEDLDRDIAHERSRIWEDIRSSDWIIDHAVRLFRRGRSEHRDEVDAVRQFSYRRLVHANNVNGYLQRRVSVP